MIFHEYDWLISYATIPGCQPKSHKVVSPHSAASSPWRSQTIPQSSPIFMGGMVTISRGKFMILFYCFTHIINNIMVNINVLPTISW